MKGIFTFSLRLLICLLAAKTILRVLEVETRVYLAGLTALFLANVYLFDYLDYRHRLMVSRWKEPGWLWTRAREQASPAPRPDPEKPLEEIPPPGAGK
jgi:hypothetical protein